MLELEARYPSEESCREYLSALRWPDGIRCPVCQCEKTWEMKRGLKLCSKCRRQFSVTAGTIFQDSHLPLKVWFRAIWHVTSQKRGISALALQRELGLGSYKTAWTLLHKLRRAMVRPGRDRLTGIIEVDETYWGGEEVGVRGRGAQEKALILIAAQVDGPRIGRIRLRRAPDFSRETLHGFIGDVVEPGSTVRTDGLPSYMEMKGYNHKRRIQGPDPATSIKLLPRVHQVASLLKRWLLGTHQGAVGNDMLDYYLDEFVFRFNRRTSRSRGKLFYRLLQQAVQLEAITYDEICHHKA